MPQINPDIIVLTLIALLIILVGWIIRLEFRLNNLLKGGDKKSLESSIKTLLKSEAEYKTFKDDMEKYLKNVEFRLRRSIQGIETIRFNPFKGTGTGGSQSFATAFINEKGNGVVISTIYTRERVGIFSKPIKAGKSEYDLTDEEKKVIKSALIKKQK